MIGRWVTSVLLACALVATAGGVAAQARTGRLETLFYMTNNEDAVTSFRAHAGQIAIVAPQVFSVEGDGVVWGRVDPRVLATAHERGVKVMPLIHNPGFNQETVHALLSDANARRRAIDMMVRLGKEQKFWGWQFDFENIHVSDRDAFTTFYREAAAALHAAGLTISVAVVPTDGKSGATRFHRYMLANWRGSFDMRALAAAGDFLSLMTYAQHSGVATPGPVAGLPWMRRMLEYALAAGVPRGKLSLGLPTYSGYWYPDYDSASGAGVRGAEVAYDRATGLLEANGVTPTWLADQATSMAYWERDGTFEYLFLEDARAFKAKLDLFAAHPGLRGISVWVLGAEDPAVWTFLPQ